jgi:signal transduction histidine kinase
MGKILVIINLVFSLVTGALLIVVFATRTNWKTDPKYGNDALAAQAKAAVQAANAWQTEREQAIETSNTQRRDIVVGLAKDLNVPINQDQDLDKLRADLVAGAKDLEKKHEKALADEKAKTAKAELEQKVALANLESIRSVNSRLGDEIKGLQADVDRRNKRISELLDESKLNHDKFVDADIRAKSLADRNKQLMDQLELVSKEVERLKAAGAGGGVRNGEIVSNPPPEDVHGRIKATDAQTGYVTLDIGSDSGLNKDNTLEVYRLKPEPKYLGTIRIVAVNAHEAVGRPITAQRKGLIQVGDEVAANINGKR